VNSLEKAQWLSRETGVPVYASHGKIDGHLFARIGQTRSYSGEAYTAKECEGIVHVYRKHGNPVLLETPSFRAGSPETLLPPCEKKYFRERQITEMERFLSGIARLKLWTMELMWPLFETNEGCVKCIYHGKEKAQVAMRNGAALPTVNNICGVCEYFGKQGIE
jgi:hypothetical protein